MTVTPLFEDLLPEVPPLPEESGVPCSVVEWVEAFSFDLSFLRRLILCRFRSTTHQTTAHSTAAEQCGSLLPGPKLQTNEMWGVWMPVMCPPVALSWRRTHYGNICWPSPASGSRAEKARKLEQIPNRFREEGRQEGEGGTGHVPALGPPVASG